jgi:hypothetical protein
VFEADAEAEAEAEAEAGVVGPVIISGDIALVIIIPDRTASSMGTLVFRFAGECVE